MIDQDICSSQLFPRVCQSGTIAEGANSHIHPSTVRVEKLKFATLSRAKCEEVSEDVSK